MTKTIRRLSAALLIAALFLCLLPVMNADAAPKRPASCRFLRWNDTGFTSCRIAWNKVSGLGSSDYYEVRWIYTNNQVYNRRYQYSRLHMIDLSGLSPSNIYKVQVRVVRTNGSYITSYSGWSNTAYIVPLPRSVSLMVADQKRNYVQASWSRVTGASGYTLWLTTKPDGKWSLNQTVPKGTQSAVIKKHNGSRLKKSGKHKNYYYYLRIFPRNYRSGKYIPVPAPSASYYYRFRIVSN